MKTIVFGESGFLGNYVADALTDAGYDVVVFDCGESPYLGPDREMIVGSILDKKIVEGAVKGCDVVYNFAGIADLDEAARRPVESVEVNILGNTIVLEACRKIDGKRFVFASSLYVYSKAGSFYRSTKNGWRSVN